MIYKSMTKPQKHSFVIRAKRRLIWLLKKGYDIATARKRAGEEFGVVI